MLNWHLGGMVADILLSSAGKGALSEYQLQLRRLIGLL